MDLSRLFGKARADVIGVFGDVVAQLLELLPQLALVRRHDGDRRFGGGVAAAAGGVDAGGGGLRRIGVREARRHDGLLDLGGTADRAGHQAALGLLVIGGRVLEPALEGVVVLAVEARSGSLRHRVQIGRLGHRLDQLEAPP